MRKIPPSVGVLLLLATATSVTAQSTSPSTSQNTSAAPAQNTGAAPAQNASALPPVAAPAPACDPIELHRRIEELEREFKQQNEQISNLSTSLISSRKVIDELKGDLKLVRQELTLARQELDANVRNQAELNLKFAQIAIPDKDAGAGKFILNLRGNMQSPAFQKDLRHSARAVLSIQNPRGEDCYLEINGVRWHVLKNEPTSIAPVPLGDVMVKSTACGGDPVKLPNDKDEWRYDDQKGYFFLKYELPCSRDSKASTASESARNGN
jgi:uncharacterized coiled-coil protein SlyX